ncbi:Menaquinone reductase, multiheme cytochrome c subunit [bacterium HR19]|nr:Menaquinone reductase, multiheme cytochrome c subunit [bacterium HR19]
MIRTKKEKLKLIAFFFIFSFFLGFTFGDIQKITLKFAKGAKQPIFFSHKVHIEVEELECTDCHQYVKEGKHATLPKLSVCSDCHTEPPDKFQFPEFKDEEEKFRTQYVDAGKEVPWIKVNKLPGHVYFNHKAHVVWGEMECGECHAKAEEKLEPYSKPDIAHITMGKCISCHERKGAVVDCIACHK